MINWEKKLQEKNFPNLKEMFNHYYVQRKLSMGVLARIFDCSCHAIKVHLKAQGIKSRGKELYKIDWDQLALEQSYTSAAKMLVALYLTEEKSIGQIANLLRISTTSIREKLVYYNIPRRSPGLGRYWARERDERKGDKQ